MGFSIGNVFKGAVEGFKSGGIFGAFTGAASSVLGSGVLDGFLGKASSKVNDFFENNPIGKIMGRVFPGLVEGVQSLLNPANLAGIFGGAKNPGDFLQAFNGVNSALRGIFN